MGQISRNCPHCYTNNTAFHAFGEYVKSDKDIFTTAFYCAGCFGGIIAEVKMIGGKSPFQYNGDIDDSKYLQVLKWYPIPEATSVPESLPDNIAKFYLQAAESLKAKNFDACAMMSRKTLEVAVKTLAPELTGVLYSRIEELADQNLITPDLKDWAHVIRDDGNFAAHENEPVSPEFAQELLSFTEMFLLYTFTMPKMVEEKRRDEDPDEV